jgi:hypothetical protein
LLFEAEVVVVGGAPFAGLSSESELLPELVPLLSLKMLFIFDLSTAEAGVDVSNVELFFEAGFNEFDAVEVKSDFGCEAEARDEIEAASFEG